MLEHQNFVIENVELWSCNQTKEALRLLYLIDLNIYGRGKVTSPTTSRRELVELLCAVNLSKRCVRGVRCSEKYPRHHILYGLLRMAPGLWSGGEIIQP